jgi:nucleotide-binding universal stress UspA family protein
MEYKTILVNLDIDGPIKTNIEFAIDLAIRTKGKLIGFCAADARMPMMGPEGGALAADVWNEEKEDIEHRFKELHSDFIRLVAGAVETGWISVRDNPTRSLSVAARIADLIIMGAPRGVATGNAYRNVDPGSAALQAGRPLLVIANEADRLLTNTVVIAWKDTREARRAVSDAIPLLRLANEIIIVTVDPDPDNRTSISVADVATYLKRHGIIAKTEVLQADDESPKLIDFLTASNTDLIIAGAYGHSRLREWAFGGVTRSLLNEVDINRFMSC